MIAFPTNMLEFADRTRMTLEPYQRHFLKILEGDPITGEPDRVKIIFNRPRRVGRSLPTEPQRKLNRHDRRAEAAKARRRQ